MKLLDQQDYHSYRKKPPHLSIPSAADRLVDSSDPYSSDDAHDALRSACNAGQLIGRLIEKLHEKKLLDDDEVLALLDGRFKKVEDDEQT